MVGLPQDQEDRTHHGAEVGPGHPQFQTRPYLCEIVAEGGHELHAAHVPDVDGMVQIHLFHPVVRLQRIQKIVLDLGLDVDASGETDLDSFNTEMKERFGDSVNATINVQAAVDAGAGVYVSLMTAIVAAILALSAVILGATFLILKDSRHSVAKANSRSPAPAIAMAPTGTVKVHFTIPIPLKNSAVSGLMMELHRRSTGSRKERWLRP